MVNFIFRSVCKTNLQLIMSIFFSIIYLFQFNSGVPVTTFHQKQSRGGKRGKKKQIIKEMVF